jgi:regulator of protease activity HflC (stomatin/prohibitin superfamily)
MLFGGRVLSNQPSWSRRGKAIIEEPIMRLSQKSGGEDVMDVTWIIGLVVLVTAVILILVATGIFIVKQWEKTAVLRFGRIVRMAEPGLNFRMPLIETIYPVDMRMQSIRLDKQFTITKDNISVGIDAVVFMKVEDPQKTIIAIENYKDGVVKYTQTSLRDVIGKYKLNELLENREEVASALEKKVDELSKGWGVDISKAEIQDIALPEDMKRAFAVQAEAEREAQAVQIKAEAELKASEMLKKAAENMKDPNAMQLRILSTVSEASKEAANTIIMALPLETLKYAGIGDLGALASINSSAARRRAEERRKREESTESEKERKLEGDQ